MTKFSEVSATLRKKNRKQYALLAACCFFSVLLITAYVTMMRSPTVLTVLPEGGDSRKQVMMIFVLAVIGCAVFTTYASSLFFRFKSRETGIFLALGASKARLRGVLTQELALIALLSCGLGALLGASLAYLLWQGFRLLIVDSTEMAFTFDPQAYLFALAFSLFVFMMLFVMMVRFLKRSNILDVVNESRKAEPIRLVPSYYGKLGIALTLLGAFLGYIMPSVIIHNLQWYPPEGLTAIFYAPALIGLYMILLHTVVNGWRRSKNRYKGIVSTSMMRFQGRQTVRNMLVVTVLVAGAYFGSFYTPLLAGSTTLSFAERPVDYAFHYRADQDMVQEPDIRQLAEKMDVQITSYTQQPLARLGVDGEQQVESRGPIGTTYEVVYRDLLRSNLFLSESAYEALSGENLNLQAGTVSTIFDREGSSGGMTDNETFLVTNPITKQTLGVVPNQEVLCSDILFGYKVLCDSDYDRITAGLPKTWREELVFFNVTNVDKTYDFSKVLFNQIVDRSGPEVEVFDSWDPVAKMQDEAAGKPYFHDNDQLLANGFTTIDYDQRDSSEFRLSWQYMPQFRVLDQNEFFKSTAVFNMLFVFVAILCFSAVIVILFTRSMTIAMTNRQVYDDLRHLGASDTYLYRTVRMQISRIFFVPILTGTLLISVFYSMILFFNDNRISAGELAGGSAALGLVVAISLMLYGVYRITLQKVCQSLTIRKRTHA